MTDLQAPAAHAHETAPGAHPDTAAWLFRWADLEARPRAVVDGARALYWANRTAREAFAHGRDLVVRNGRLETADHRQAEGLRGFLGGTGPRMTHWCLPRTDGDGAVLFRAWRISGPAEPTVIGMVFHGTGGDFTPQWADVGACFGLTGAEHQVARLLLEGLNVERIAGKLAISVETVRTHVRRAYAKIGVSSREALFARLAPFRLV